MSTGIGVMIRSLGGNEETVNAVKGAIGKVVSHARLDDDALQIMFTDGTGLSMSDEGQSCCETRYMRTDDDLIEMIGSTVLDFELKDAPSEDDKYGEHEVQFLEVKTSNGAYTMVSHNEHNGYYGGFWIAAHAIPKP